MQTWHTPHDARDIGIMNDAHRRALCAGAALDSGEIWSGFDDDLNDELLHAVGASDIFEVGSEEDHARGHVKVRGQKWAWHFVYYADKSLEGPGNIFDGQVYRLLVVARR